MTRMNITTARHGLQQAISLAESNILHTRSCLDALPLVGFETEKAHFQAVLNASYSRIYANEQRLVQLGAS